MSKNPAPSPSDPLGSGSRGGSLPQKPEAFPPAELPSGRCIRVRVDEEGESLEVLSPKGDLEIGIQLTAEGPVLKLRGARLEIDSTDTVAVQCRRFEVKALEDLKVQTGGELAFESGANLEVRSKGDTNIDADWVNLNCKERAGTGWHDDPELPQNQQQAALEGGDEEDQD
jgi:hypothetical protein